MKFEYLDIPADLLEKAKEAREHMVEAAAETSEELMNKYLEDGDLSEEEIITGIRAAARWPAKIIPVFCGSAFKNKGVQAMLDARDRLSARAIGSFRRSRASTKTTRKTRAPPMTTQPFSALAFKIVTDPFVGALTFFRVYSGVLNRATRFTIRSRAGRSASAACCRCMPTSAKRSRKFAPATSPRRSA